MSDLIETAKKLMSLDDFRWWEGMGGGPKWEDGRVLWERDGRVGTSIIEQSGECACDGAEHVTVDASSFGTIDLSDPATQGCVMAWCGEVFGPSFCVSPKLTETGGFVYRAQTIDVYRGPLLEVINRSPECPTRIEAACAALLGAR